MSGRILHVGPGNMRLPAWLPPLEEVRLDLSPDFKPDIIASITDMGDIGEFSFVYSSHVLEHLYPYDVPKALREFYRVLTPGGMAVVLVPDLEGIEATDDVLYVSPRGPVTGLDMIYGMSEALPAEPHMAHHTGFVERTFRKALVAAGFEVMDIARSPAFTLFAMAKKPITEAATQSIPAAPQLEEKANGIFDAA